MVLEIVMRKIVMLKIVVLEIVMLKIVMIKIVILRRAESPPRDPTTDEAIPAAGGIIARHAAKPRDIETFG